MRYSSCVPPFLSSTCCFHWIQMLASHSPASLFFCSNAIKPQNVIRLNESFRDGNSSSVSTAAHYCWPSSQHIWLEQTLFIAQHNWMLLAALLFGRCTFTKRLHESERLLHQIRIQFQPPFHSCDKINPYLLHNTQAIL